MLKEVFKVIRASSLWPLHLTEQNEPTDFIVPSGCLLAKIRRPALPILTQKQAMHRNLQPARVEKYSWHTFPLLFSRKPGLAF